MAVGAVGSDQDGGAEGFGTGCGDDSEFDVGGKFSQCGNRFDFAEGYAASMSSRCAGLGEAEVVETIANSHGANRVARTDANFERLVRR